MDPGEPSGVGRYACPMPTRWLLVAAAVTAAVIVLAGAVWIIRLVS